MTKVIYHRRNETRGRPSNRAIAAKAAWDGLPAQKKGEIIAKGEIWRAYESSEAKKSRYKQASEAHKRNWANMTAEQRAERGAKISAGKRKAHAKKKGNG